MELPQLFLLESNVRGCVISLWRLSVDSVKRLRRSRMMDSSTLHEMHIHEEQAPSQTIAGSSCSWGNGQFSGSNTWCSWEVGLLMWDSHSYTVLGVLETLLKHDRRFDLEILIKIDQARQETNNLDFICKQEHTELFGKKKFRLFSWKFNWSWKFRLFSVLRKVNYLGLWYTAWNGLVENRMCDDSNPIPSGV